MTECLRSNVRTQEIEKSIVPLVTTDARLEALCLVLVEQVRVTLTVQWNLFLTGFYSVLMSLRKLPPCVRISVPLEYGNR